VTDKTAALRDIADIARRHDLSLAEIATALNAAKDDSPARQGSVLSRLFSYIGAILVFAGLCIFVSMQWDDMSGMARVVATFGTGIAAFFMAIAFLHDARFEKAATPLFLVAALFQPAGIFVFLHEYASGGDPRHACLLVSAFMVLQQGLTFIALRRTALAFACIFFLFSFFATAFNLLAAPPDVPELALGAMLLCIGHALSRSPHAAISGFWVFVGAVLLFSGVYDQVENTPVEILFSGFAAFMIYLSVVMRSRALLSISTLALVAYIAKFTSDHFAHTLGWPLVLILVGGAFIGLGAAAVRLNNKYIRARIP
jgi:hypothetical protein